MAGKSTIDSVISELRRHRPRKDDAGTYDVDRSTTNIMSKVNYVLRSGLDPFDRVTGGIPFGRVTEIYGLESCGKSALVQLLAVQAQRGEVYDRIKNEKLQNPNVTVLYIDNEQSLDSGERAVIDGTPLDVILARCDTVDDLFRIVDVTINAISKVETETGIPQYIVIVVDTIAGTSSKEEMSQDWSKEDFNRQAKFMSKGFRRMRLAFTRHNVAMICVNQVRDSFKAKLLAGRFVNEPQDDDFTTFGGRALKFYSSLRVFMHAISKNYRLSKSTRFSQGLLIHFIATKNRLMKPFRYGRMALLFEGGLNNTYSRLETLIALHVAEIKKDGTGRIQFMFERHGVSAESFKLSGRQRNPEIGSKAEWPAFYSDHRQDFDKLWETAINLMFVDAQSGNEAADELDVDDVEDAVDAKEYDPLTEA